LRRARTSANQAPTRISPIRAGVAQYAASGPHTAAITGAASSDANVTAATASNRRRGVRTRANSTAMNGGHTQ